MRKALIHYLLPFLISLFSFPVTAGNFQSKADSLLSLVKTDKADTIKVKHFIDIAWEISYQNSDTALHYSREALKLSEELRKSNSEGSPVWITATKQLGQVYYEIGSFNDDKGNFPDALDYYQKGLDVAKLLEKYVPKVSKYAILDRKSRLLGGIGMVYNGQGNSPKALEYLIDALKMGEEEEKASDESISKSGKNLAAAWLGNIGIIYYGQKDFDNALSYYQQALKKNEELGQDAQSATWLGNIGLAYAEKDDPDKALEYYLKAKKLNEKIGSKRSLATNLGNIGSLFRAKKIYPASLDFYLQALKIHEESGNKRGIAATANNIGSLYNEMLKTAPPAQKQELISKSESFLLRSLSISDSIGYLVGQQDNNYNLSELEYAKGDYKKSLEYFKRYSAAKDTLFNADRKEEITRKALNYEFEKKAAETKAEQDKKDAIAAEAEKKQRIITWAVTIGLILVAIIAIVILRSLRITRKQKQQIEEQKITVESQKELIEEKQKEIIDSITYAKRLQQAILPPADLFKSHLPESFIYYRPKDIVAGDFYWLEVIRCETGDPRKETKKGDFSNLTSQYSDLILVAAADSTGHGVPGAMVSIVCSNALNRAVKEFEISEPGKILDKTRGLVMETFEKSSAEVKDGMDISLAAIDKKSGTITWSGANNPLWYYSASMTEMAEIKADKQPIGKTEQPKPFTTHNIKLQKGDMLFLLTDGYPDQFGGPSGKKFKHKQLKELLFVNRNKSIAEQEQILAAEFERWKGNLEQIDDVTVIGIRI